MRFADRADAGRRLADALAGVALDEPVVLALPRGGVPVGAVVAARLHAPLDVLVARKVGAPFQPELGLGAVAEDDTLVLDRERLAALHLTAADLAATIAREQAELVRRCELYRGGRAPLTVTGRTAVVVDDGLATGGTARAAVATLRRRGADRIVVAVPVCAPDTARRLREETDAVVCVAAPHDFVAVGQWYDDFAQVPDDVVVALLAGARRHADGAP